MSDAAKTKVLLERYSTARIPFVVIDSIEKTRVLEILKEVSEKKSLSFYVHTLLKGTYDINTGKVQSEDKSVYGAIDYMSEQMKRRQNLTLILTDIPDISAENSESKSLLALVTLANETGGVVFVISNNAIWNQLQRQGMRVKLDLPSEEEMYSIIDEFLEDYRHSIPIEWNDSDLREAASALSGVSKIEAENILAALIANGKVSKADLDEVWHSKDRLFSDISGLERIEVDENAKDVGGLAGLKKWLDAKKELLSPEKRAILKANGVQPPRGILFVGVPGCGKSLSAKSVSANWKLPLYRLDFATVQGSFVGQSEKQLKDALTTAENVAPCILWIDEIEKGLSGAGHTNDGGVSTRMVGQFLFWLQECKKQVFVVATANDVSMLPSELLRRGRFDELFFIDLPTSEERREILQLYMRKYLKLDFSGPFSNTIVDLTEGFTGADIESTVRELHYRTVENKAFILSEENILSAFENVVPLSQTSPEKIEAIREWGKERAVPASGRPIGEDKLNSDKKTGHSRRVLV